MTITPDGPSSDAGDESGASAAPRRRSTFRGVADDAPAHRSPARSRRAGASPAAKLPAVDREAPTTQGLDPSEWAPLGAPIASVPSQQAGPESDEELDELELEDTVPAQAVPAARGWNAPRGTESVPVSASVRDTSTGGSIPAPDVADRDLPEFLGGPPRTSVAWTRTSLSPTHEFADDSEDDGAEDLADLGAIEHPGSASLAARVAEIEDAPPPAAERDLARDGGGALRSAASPDVPGHEGSQPSTAPPTRRSLRAPDAERPLYRPRIRRGVVKPTMGGRISDFAAGIAARLESSPQPPPARPAGLLMASVDDAPASRSAIQVDGATAIPVPPRASQPESPPATPPEATPSEAAATEPAALRSRRESGAADPAARVSPQEPAREFEPAVHSYSRPIEQPDRAPGLAAPWRSVVHSSAEALRSRVHDLRSSLSAPGGHSAHAADARHSGHAPADADAAHPGHEGDAAHSSHEAHSGQDSHSGDDSHSGHDVHSGHDSNSGHEGHDPEAFRRKFWVSLLLAVPTLLFSRGLQDILGLDGPRFPGSDVIPALFGTALVVYGGLVFLRGGWDEIRARTPGMMTLISLAIVVAFGYSAAVLFGLDGMDFWWELATLIVIMLLGHWIEMFAVMRAGDALGELAALLPDTAERLHDGSADEGDIVPVSELQVGDRVIVRPGGRIPADGTVLEGESAVDESLLTGESAPVAKAFGSALIAGSISTRWLTFEVTSTGEQTALSGIMRMVADAQASKSDVQLLADRAAKWLFYVALAAAFLTFVVWALIRPEDPAFVLERVVTVLVIACPHALGLAIPLAALISTTTGARHGLLVRSRAALEEARLVDVVLFDKTGTLTQGKQGVVDVIPAVTSATGTISVIGTRTGAIRVVDPAELDARKNELIGLAANAEGRSEHPIGRAIVAEGRLRGLAPLLTTEFMALPGRGVQADVYGRKISVLGPRALIERGLHGGADMVFAAKAAHTRGESVVYVLEGNDVLGMLSIADAVRPESREAVDALRRRGIRVAMVTGDAHAVGVAVADQLGLDEVYAEVLPGEKASTVAELQRTGARVAMVGDGVNDAPALAQADVGIAIGAGTGVAIESAAIVLASSDPRGVADLLTLSRATYRTMLQNLGWAAGYNVLALPLAAGVGIGAGLVISPAVGAILMSVSTIVVALNAQLLRRVRMHGR